MEFAEGRDQESIHDMTENELLVKEAGRAGVLWLNKKEDLIVSVAVREIMCGALNSRNCFLEAGWKEMTSNLLGKKR